jgi:hypothetical protein
MATRDGLAFTIVALGYLSVATCGSSAKKPPPANLDEVVSRIYSAVCQLSVTCGEMPDMPTCVASFPAGAPACM